jgi:plastocyanin
MRRKMLAAAALIFVVTAAHADGPTVFQENRKFSENEITVKQGQSITFTNHDTVTHNVYSRPPAWNST